MKIDKVMNNNVVSSIDEDGQEIIVVGTGVGFQGKEGKPVDEKKIQKIFRLEDPKMIRKLKEILQDLPMEQFEISTAIIEHAKQSLGTELNENIYVTLTDHIHFAIQRYEDHMNFPNPMLREVKLFYEKEFASERMDDMNNDVQEMIQKICPEEYQCARYIKSFIKKQYKKDMTSAEIAYLTMHIERIRKNSIEKGEENV